MRPLARRVRVNLAAFLLVLSGLSLLAFALVPREQRESRDVERLREEWFYRQRAFPHRYVPARAHGKALRQLEQKLAAEEAARAFAPQFAPATTPPWIFIGPQPIQTPYSAPIGKD